MLRHLFFLFATLVPWTLVSANDVLDLSEVDFESAVREHETILVEFFAPWCGHCKRLAPEYEKAASILKHNEPPVPLAKVDCTSENGGKDVCSKYGVSGYPTLKIFRQGEFSQEYNGPREADGIVKHMKGQVGPVSFEIKTIADAEKRLSKDEVVIFAFFDERDSSLEEEYLKAADKLRDTATFVHTYKDDILKKYGYSDQIILFRPKKFHSKFEDKELAYKGAAEKSKIESFVKDNYHGLVGHRTQSNFQEFKTPLVVVYYNVDYEKNPKGTNYWRNRVMKVAQLYKEKFTFAIANKDDFAGEMDDFGVSVKGDKPAVAARNSEGHKFRMEEAFALDTFEKFIQDVDAGVLKPHFKSEPVPETNDGPVKVAVAENFKDIVVDNDKDVLIEFYAPWCGHCKKLAPTYEELGTELEDEDVEIVKMDATANDVPPPFEVHGFPTLYWAPKDKKDAPQKYEGGREKEDFIKYIAKHATDELKGWNRKGVKRSKTEL